LTRLAILLGVCLTLVLALPAAAQEDDRGRLTRLIENALSDGAARQVRIDGFRGALSSEATLDRLTISDADGPWLILENARLNWRRAALLTGALRVRSLTAERLSILRPPLPAEGPDLPSPEATPFSLPDLPVSVEIGEFAIARLELGEPLLGQEAALSISGMAELDGGAGSLDIAADRLDGPEGRFVVDASFANDTRVLDLDVLLQEAEGGLAATLLNLPGAPDLRLEIAGEGPLDDIEVALALATEGTERVTGTVRSERIEDTGVQRIDVDVEGDLTPLMAEEYRPFFGTDSVLSARVRRAEDGATDLNDLTLSGAAFELEGDVSLDAQSRPTSFLVSARIANPEGDGPVRLPVAGEAELDRATLALGYDASTGDEFRLDAILEDLRLAEARIASAAITANGTITPTETGIGAVATELAATLSGLDHTDPDLATGLGDTAVIGARIDWAEGAPLTVEDLSVRGAGISVDGELTAGLGGNQVPLTFDIDADLEDIARFSGLAGQDLQGALDASLTGTAEALSGAFDILLEGQARDLAVGDLLPPQVLAGQSEVRLAAARDAEGTRIDAFSLDAAGVRAEGRATLGGGEGELPLDVDLEASVADLSRFSVLVGENLGGALDIALTGSAGIETREFDLSLVAEATDLRFGDVLPREVLAGTSELRVDATGEAEVARIDAFSFRAPGLSAEGSGSAALGDDALPVSVDLSASVDSIARFSALAGQELRGALDVALQGTAEVESGDFDVALTGQARDLRVGEAVPPALLAGPTDIRLDATREGETLRVDALSIDGRQVTVTAEGSLDPGAGGLRGTARLADLGLLSSALSGPASVTAEVERAAQGLAVDAALQGPAGVTADVSGRVGLPGGAVDLGVSGRVPLVLVNPFIAPQSVTGPLAFDLRVQGPPGLGAVSGRLTTDSARLSVPAAQLALTDIGLTANLQGGRLTLDGGGNVSSGGRVTLGGGVNLGAPSLPGDIRVTLDSVRLIDPTLYEVVIARGDLTASGPLAGGLRVAGGITLAPSEIRVPESGTGAAAPIPDIRHTGMTAAERQTLAAAGLLDQGNGGNGGGPAVGLDVRIDAPGRIFLRGRGIDAEFGGSIRIGGTTQDIVPAGRFELVRGRISILGTRLDITEGSATLQGDFDPFLNLRATSRAGQYRIFINVRGPASSPDITFTSEPFLPEDEILAQLLFGRSVSALSPVQLLQLADAATSLAGGRTDGGILSGIREGLGLDDLDLQTDAEGNTAVRAGRYLSENIYTDVTVGATGQSDLSLNIDLTPDITARGTVSTDGSSSLGVFFERDY
jgi:translocation and assembly module TamB